MEDPSKFTREDLAEVGNRHEDRLNGLNREAEDEKAFEDRRRRDLAGEIENEPKASRSFTWMAIRM